MTITSQRPDVIVGIDGSEQSFAAAKWALEESARRRAPLRVVHVWTIPVPPVAMGPTPLGWGDEELSNTPREVLDEVLTTLQSMAPDASITGHLASGSPSEELIKTSRGASMVVVGSSGLDRVSEFILGSVTMQVSAHASCPVAVVPTRHATVGGLEAGRVVVGVDGSDLSLDATRVAFDEASIRHAGLTLLHAWNTPSHDPAEWGIPHEQALVPAHGEEVRHVSETVAGLAEKYPDVHVQQRFVHGRPASALASASAGAELVAVGSRGRGGFASLLLGSTSRSLLHHACAPVLVVRPGSLAD